MRKILRTLLILTALAAAMLIGWLYYGRELSLLLDRVQTIGTETAPIKWLSYEGNGSGGALLVNDLHLSLDRVAPHMAPVHVGTNKNEELALSFGGKVFNFGPLNQAGGNAEGMLAAVPQPGDEALIAIRRSVMSWAEPFTFLGPGRKRHVYYDLTWKKPSGAELQILWRYEQHHHGESGWGSGFMTREGSTGLVEIDIH